MRIEQNVAGVVLVATPAQQELARLVAEARYRGHQHCRRPDQHLGSDAANRAADYFGALAEIAVRDALEQQGQTPECVLIADRPPDAPDFVFNDGSAYDIKASPPGKGFLCVNFAAHHNIHKRPDFYLPVLFDTPARMRIMALVPHADVTRWRLMTNRHAPYYSTHRDCLESLRSLESLNSAASER